MKKSLRDKLIGTKFERHLTGTTALGVKGRDEELFRTMLKGQYYKHIVEIGTCKGIGTALLVDYADKVTTFDIKRRPTCKPLWEFLGITKKIKHMVIPNREELYKAVESLKFDLVFIDNGKQYKAIINNFRISKKCGKVLFHDYSKNWLAIFNFINNLDQSKLIKRPPFVLWEDK